ncbi:MAG TPA: VWA domain-containing protein [Blastocatellia bacterium]|nr:VWA domain-containing protein [Blastocatellia bacterium]HMV83606.1 VWA domain-containing protein [Blastocatellia bacterium]HMX26566.1 VWA domain-containing protein [Blastocatellia bacterium]HMY73517.1 VWA domain-containing protein [Blastocatellia bacterium]HMZ22320.1 VWA domain-containing protein [Blastocatellia bacterium]
MSESDYKDLLLKVFIQVRKALRLGVAELLSAMELLDDWEFDSPDQLRDDLCMFWCHTKSDVIRLQEVWEQVLLKPTTEDKKRRQRTLPKGSGDDKTGTQSSQTKPEAFEQIERSSAASPSILPVKASAPAATMEEPADLNSYWPLSKLSMAYGWRYLRLDVNDGAANILDLAATVDKAAREGLFTEPVYRRQRTNHAHLILLVDQKGSMMPFHRFTRDLVDSALESGHFAEDHVERFYFQNVIEEKLYTDPYLIQSVAFADVLARCDGDTSILIVSDAGAARGLYHSDRVLMTTKFIAHLRRRTNQIAWLNPMPEERWTGTSAQMIAYMTPMLRLNQDGFSRAIDVARGIVIT